MNAKPDPTAVKVMTALAMLSEVEKSLRFLAEVGVVKSESIVKGCRKFVKDHPEIQAWIDREAFADEGSNVRSQATDADLSRQVACTDGLGVAVPPEPTFGETT